MSPQGLMNHLKDLIASWLDSVKQEGQKTLRAFANSCSIYAGWRIKFFDATTHCTKAINPLAAQSPWKPIAIQNGPKCHKPVHFVQPRKTNTAPWNSVKQIATLRPTSLLTLWLRRRKISRVNGNRSTALARMKNWVGSERIDRLVKRDECRERNR
jgi:hypothetical protein